MTTANEYSIKVVGHVPYQVSLQEVYDSGQYSIEHLFSFLNKEHALNSEGMDEILAKLAASDTWVCPTAVVCEYMLTEPKQLSKKSGLEYLSDLVKNYFITTSEQQYLPPYLDIDYFLRLLKKLYDSGIKLTIGIDTFNQGFSLHDELLLFTEAGIPIYETLKIATAGSAEHLEISDQTGTVEEGKNADLVLLNINPLENINFRENIEGVMVRGIWLDRETLDSLLVTCEKRASGN